MTNEQTNEIWPILNSDRRNNIVPAGRYSAVLASIRLIEAPVYQKPDQKEPKLVFTFVAEGQEDLTEITAFVRPTNSLKGNMYKLLCQLSVHGIVPEDVRRDSAKFQAFAQSFVNKRFKVMSAPSKSGKHNICLGAVPLTDAPATDASNSDDIPF